MQQHSRMFRNVSANAIARVIYLATRFFIPPFVLGRIGMEAYGLYGTVFVLVAYFGMSAIGFSSAYVKFVAQFSADGDTCRANRLLSSGFSMMVVIGTLCFGIFAACWPLVALWMKVPAVLDADARALALMIVGVFFAYLALSVFRDALSGMQEIAAVQKVWGASFLIETVLIFALVGSGLGLRGLGLAFCARTLLEVGGNYLQTKRYIPWLRVRMVVPDRESLKLLLGFGGIVQLNSMLAIFLNSVERMIATPLIGLTASGLLDIGKRFPGMATSIPSAFAASVVPSAADIQARAVSKEDEKERLAELYTTTTRSMNAVSGVLFSFLAFSALPCLMFWLGKVPEGAVILTVLFAIGSQFHMLTGPGTSILKASGKPKMEFHYSVANAIALAVFVPLSKVVFGGWSATGIASACTVATIVSASWFLSRAHRELGISLKTFAGEIFLPGFMPYVVRVICLVPALGLPASGDRLHAAMELALVGTVHLVFTLWALYSFCANDSERMLVKRLVKERIGRALAPVASPLMGAD